MTFEEFNDLLRQDQPPKHLNPLLLSLWYDAKGDWESSHNIAQDIHGKDGARIHAYLHRKEGDAWNADYWYRQAGVSSTLIPLEEEWKKLVISFLDLT